MEPSLNRTGRPIGCQGVSHRTTAGELWVARESSSFRRADQDA
jgi:hypothetical protein